MAIKNFNILFILVSLSIIFSFSNVNAAVNVNYSVFYSIQEPTGTFNNTNTPINGASIRAHYCLNEACTLVNPTPFYSYTAPSNSNILRVVYPTTLVGFGYSIYAYKPGYIGWERHGITYAGTGSISSPNNLILFNKREKSANLTNFYVSNSSNCVSLFANVVSPIADVRYTNVPLSENVSVLASFVVLNDSIQLFSSTRSLVMNYSEIRPINFSYCGITSPGNYTFLLSTDVTDQKIINSIRDTKSYTFLALQQNDTNNEDYNNTIININNTYVNVTNYYINNYITVNISGNNIYNIYYFLNNQTNLSVIEGNSSIIYLQPIFNITIVIYNNITNNYFYNYTIIYNNSSNNTPILLPQVNILFPRNNINLCNQSTLLNSLASWQNNESPIEYSLDNTTFYQFSQNMSINFSYGWNSLLLRAMNSNGVDFDYVSFYLDSSCDSGNDNNDNSRKTHYADCDNPYSEEEETVFVDNSQEILGIIDLSEGNPYTYENRNNSLVYVINGLLVIGIILLVIILIFFV